MILSHYMLCIPGVREKHRLPGVFIVSFAFQESTSIGQGFNSTLVIATVYCVATASIELYRHLYWWFSERCVCPVKVSI